MDLDIVFWLDADTPKPFRCPINIGVFLMKNDRRTKETEQTGISHKHIDVEK